ncbi:MAG: hypothetical protein LBE12_06425 [Planctomycetaceae bacterium]|nr:hypothetical protein [Planctomycetaceae bacterium]
MSNLTNTIHNVTLYTQNCQIGMPFLKTGGISAQADPEQQHPTTVPNRKK